VLAACYLHVFFNDYSLVNKGPAVGNSIGWDLERARWSEQTGVAPRKDQLRPFFHQSRHWGCGPVPGSRHLGGPSSDSMQD